MKTTILLDEANESNSRIVADQIESLSNSVANGKKKFSCTQCLKNFSSKQCLKEHVYTHTNEKPYVCKCCKKKFRHASQFTLHKKTHGAASKLIWVKLSDLLKNYIEQTDHIFEFFEKINLPPISGPQESKLPGIETLIQRLSSV
ncbi:hypothetical protein SteCoe_35404 [Stentor coeruleus]|uniref:C2H2-type domain-containing protein n=1 Tax=Stentor coeruleus TaxID=5963 RepID=A0A1R2ASE3_9CILI|nr:hypothetical protein SteCoe_35404 [Stentor coeruleus]